ncbi:hypothetical protein [Geitlerinema sp. PCC 9228]|uniref:hypothetical protein n=1 Tax=Geitlerinema sp. PCC 9228 TaxID=111611 RepID=UPI0008F9A06F|nr:hypothetical protein [Geitlerinema sp. PCC 9228]
MFSQPNFTDRSLQESFYQALILHFCNGLDVSTQNLLQICHFGFAPDSEGERTFFIVATEQEVAKQLVEYTDRIIERVCDLMPGIAKVAICFQPPNSSAQDFDAQYMLGKVFSVNYE